MQTCSPVLSPTCDIVNANVNANGANANGVVAFGNGDTLSLPPLDGRPVGFHDVRNRPKKRSAEVIAQQKAAAQKQRDERDEDRVKYADEFHGQNGVSRHGQSEKGPETVRHHDFATEMTAENFGMVYRGIPAPRDSNQLEAIVRLGNRITARDRSIAGYAPNSWELMDRSAA